MLPCKNVSAYKKAAQDCCKNVVCSQPLTGNTSPANSGNSIFISAAPSLESGDRFINSHQQARDPDLSRTQVQHYLNKAGKSYLELEDFTRVIRDIGEKGLLERLQRFCPPEIIGDDAAVIAIEPEQSLVVTTDVLVDEVHFSDRTTSPEDAGWRAAAANLSDLAAMGATPLGITVGLGLRSDVLVSWVERLYQGITECLQHYNTAIVGGDVCRSQVITIAITAFGQVHHNRIIRRSAAQVGNAIIVTGVHGASRAGLELLLHPELGQNLNNAERLALIQAHQRPQPRLDVLPILGAILNQSKIRVAGMDSSDGLADALVQLCQASGVGAKIERSHIPMPPALNRWVSPEQALDWALYGGEDFELVLCLPPEQAVTLVQQLGNGAAVVGTITSDLEVLLIDQLGRTPDQVLSLSRGFQHFSQ